jgi:hypothetical protein
MNAFVESITAAACVLIWWNLMSIAYALESIAESARRSDADDLKEKK